MSFVVVDYNKGNLRSVQKGLQLAGCEAIISQDPAAILAAQAIVLPGVGSFADASKELLASGQMPAIKQQIAAGVPFLGICLGLQLLFERGDEGLPSGQWAEGLGVLQGYCRRIDHITADGKSVKVPHVGWNQVDFAAANSTGLSPLFAGIPSGSNFYFTHSYQCQPTNRQNVLATVTHATEFACVVRKDQAFGVQFHPEKSSHLGLVILKNFVKFATDR
jgi:glutamine amidotransferase